MKSAQAERWGGLGAGGGRGNGTAPPRLAARPPGAPAPGSGRSLRGAGALPPDSGGLGALRSSAQEINNVPWAGETLFAPVFRGFVSFCECKLGSSA